MNMPENVSYVFFNWISFRLQQPDILHRKHSGGGHPHFSRSTIKDSNSSADWNNLLHKEYLRRKTSQLSVNNYQGFTRQVDFISLKLIQIIFLKKKTIAFFQNLWSPLQRYFNKPLTCSIFLFANSPDMRFILTSFRVFYFCSIHFFLISFLPSKLTFS